MMRWAGELRELTKLHCNVCGYRTFDDFHGRKNAMCRACGSLERTRFLWLHLDKLVKPGHRVLHFAPERGIYKRLTERLDSEHYTISDINAGWYGWAADLQSIDMTNLDDLPSFEFDFIVHSHVLEHIPCNEAYTLFHLHRALKKDGRHIFIIPIRRGRYYDCAYNGVDHRERERRFDQSDHVRIFGLEDLDMSLGKLLELPQNYDALDQFSIEQLTGIGLPETYWKGLSVNSVLNLGRHDMKLLLKEPPPPSPSTSTSETSRPAAGDTSIDRSSSEGEEKGR